MLMVAALYLVYKLLFVLELIAVAALLALVLRSAVDGLKRHGLPAWLAVLTIIAGIAAFGAFVWFVVIPNVIREARRLTTGGEGSLRQEIKTVASAGADFLNSLPFVPEGFASGLPQQLQGALSGLTGSLPALAADLQSVLVAIIAVAFLSLYFAVSPGTYVSAAFKLVPADHQESARRFIDRLERKMRGWIVGTLIVSLVMGVGGGIGLWIIGIPLPLVFGIIVGVFSVIPFIGSAIGGLLPGLLALTISPTKALMVGVLFLFLAQADGNILRPLIFGREIEMSPGMVLISILVLGLLLGPVVGVFLAIPAAVLLTVIVEELTSKKPAPVDDGAQEGSSSGRSRT